MPIPCHFLLLTHASISQPWRGSQGQNPSSSPSALWRPHPHPHLPPHLLPEPNTEDQATIGCRVHKRAPAPSQLSPSPHLQHFWQGVGLLPFVLRAVRIAEVQQALVVLLQELVELRVSELQPRKLVLVLRGIAFMPAGKVGVIMSDGQAEPVGAGRVRPPVLLLASSEETWGLVCSLTTTDN